MILNQFGMVAALAGMEVQGHCDDEFLPVRDALQGILDSGQEMGASVAICVHDEMVVDLWGGPATLDGSRSVKSDTLFPVLSCSKSICSICALLLIDRGLLDIDEPVATYWPEFAAAGKEKLLVRHILTHTSGLPGWEDNPAWQDLYDWDTRVRLLANQEPWWEPGTQSGYHLHTYGFLIGEIVRRVTGKSLPDFFRSEIGEKLGADFHFGIDGKDFERVTHLDYDAESNAGDLAESNLYKRSQLSNSGDFVTLAYDPAWFAAVMPSSNGVGTARALTLAGHILANGGVAGGHRYMSADTAALPCEEQTYKLDLVIGEPMRLGLGFGLTSKDFPLPWESAIHWGGYGGSVIQIFPEIRTSLSFVPNKMYGDFDGTARAAPIENVMYDCLKEMAT